MNSMKVLDIDGNSGRLAGISVNDCLFNAIKSQSKDDIHKFLNMGISPARISYSAYYFFVDNPHVYF